MTEIEQEIRRQMLAEKSAASNTADPFGPNAFILPDAQPAPPPRHSRLQRWQSQGGLLGALATVLIFLAKAGAPLLALLGKLKFLLVLKTLMLTGGSMLVTMALEAWAFGWPFAVGIVLLIFVHECGHAVAARSLGHKVGAMVFVPFMGAMVFTGRARSAVEDAFVGIMGPVFGTVGGFVCLAINQFWPSPFWLSLAQINFAINLFNLTPMAPLDGGWIAPLFSPKLLAFGVVLLVVVAPLNPLIWLLAIMSIGRIVHGWKNSKSAYYQAPKRDRIRYGLAYIGLAALLAYSSRTLQEALYPQHFRSRVAANVVHQKGS